MYAAAVLNIGGWLWVPQNDVSGGVMQVTWREGGRMFISVAVGSRRTLEIRVRSSRPIRLYSLFIHIRIYTYMCIYMYNIHIYDIRVI